MAAPTTTPLATLLPLIATQIASVTGIDSNRILLIKENPEKTPMLQGDQDILLEPGPVQPEPNMDSAVGRAFPLVYRVLRVTIRTRFGVDLSDRADSWITDATYGHYTFEESLVAALNNFLPEDGNGNTLLQEPMHWIPSSGARAKSRDQTWGETTLSFSVLYELSMTRTI